MGLRVWLGTTILVGFTITYVGGLLNGDLQARLAPIIIIGVHSATSV